MIRNFDSIESVRNPNHYDFYYESAVGDRVISAIPSYVKLETSMMSYAFPTEEKELGNYRLDASDFLFRFLHRQKTRKEQEKINGYFADSVVCYIQKKK